MRIQPTYFTLLLGVFLLCVNVGFSQSSKQKELEARRVELRKEIQKINALVSTNKDKKKSELTLIEELNYKVSVQRNLIKVTNQQANLLTREINNNQKQISQYRDELTSLKANYAKMIERSYKNKNKQSRIMFLLSSSNFKQAYKRVQYLNQYAEFQKEQGEIIKAKTKELQAANTLLLKQKEQKKKLIAENKQIQKDLEQEMKQHEIIMQSINSNLAKYTAEVKAKQQEADRIDREIDKIIKAEIAKSNKKAGKTKSTSTSNFALTAEAKALAKDFLGNKGKLPWPVEKGVVKVRYGDQPSPIDASIRIKSSGVRISTEKGAKVRAIFNGEVMRIIQQKRSNPVVLVRHGNYISVYYNLGKVYVKPGDKVTTKQDIGEVFTNPNNGETVLKFSIYKDNHTQNPAAWIYKM
ncbi:murein hydrolase activator EnvC [Bizionia paragorgiae]|uniref:Septal ring factor EnvC, activator of murein hydrolases AmiA and AmiB n=1 Tax=Bizionia paragorgiae TaxID=283786 RepID=A0A1H3W1H1_BIZPA|nr:peptidoglycan DD-metalloendopeptidase family protein [Bizionia paragorgiae]MDX1270933.1 peptidoglycan DD-metalloendopeptidase family protein [Bizionia paragorgiae]SDZ80254.1 Septal ring factor EnvC, activator of murein hydrolases AmiA and AmiB [Bizionia paragorgiae]